MTTTRTIAHELAVAATQLCEAGIDNPRVEARLLLGRVLNIDAAGIITMGERPLDEESSRQFASMIARRARREPMSYVLGRREFWSLDFRVTTATLDPRPDSETLVEAVLTELEDRTAPYRVLDLGTGSGCLLLALLNELPNADGTATDISADALEIARGNAADLGFDDRTNFVRGHWDERVDGEFDVVISNPPYIPTANLATLQPEVSIFEPRLALDGGEDGLEAYRSLAPVIARRLRLTGISAVELGYGQSRDVLRIMSRAGLDSVRHHNDLGGILRCLVLRRKTALTRH